MANTEVLNLIIQNCFSYFTYLLPVIAFMAGANFIFSALWSMTFKAMGKIGNVFGG